MKRLAVYLLVISAIILGIAAFWEHQVYMAAVTAAQYAPRSAARTLVPAGTEIRAVVKDQVTESSKPGQPIVGLVSSPLIVNDRVVIPPGTPVKGVIREITHQNEEATISLDFGSLVIHQQEVPIQTEPVPARIPVETDLELLGSALDTLIEAGIGAALGSVIESKDGIAAGLGIGALSGASALDENSTQIILILSRPLELLV